MKKEELELIRGSGNIYRDFDVADADVRQLKAILAAEIIKTLDRGELSVRKAQKLTGIDAGDFSRVRNADFRRISVERLMAMINGLGSRVEVKVKVRRGGTVVHAATAQWKLAGALTFRRSADEYESWQETLAVRADAGLMRDIRKGLVALKARKARLYTLQELFK